jgi:zinc-ribbon domain
MFCPKCGTKNDDNNYRCTNCSTVIQAVPSAAAPAVAAMPAEAYALGGLIPYKNSSALTAYYLGLFSLVCGIFLGLPALILGIKGLKFADLNPEVKGKAHAWVGIICGGLTTLVSVAIIAIYAIAAFRK